MPVIPILVAAAVTAAPIRFERVELIAEAPGTWLNYELPQLTVYPATVALRWVEQVQVVLDLPVDGLGVGLSLADWSLIYERPLLPALDVYWSAGLDTRLLLPRGLHAGLAWRWWRLRVGLGVALMSGASWAHPDWTFWRLLPTAGVGVGRRAP